MADIEELDKISANLKSEGKYLEALDVVEQALTIRKTKFGFKNVKVENLINHMKMANITNLIKMIKPILLINIKLCEKLTKQ